jgi:rhamnose transport system substrate-binding protein
MKRNSALVLGVLCLMGILLGACATAPTAAPAAPAAPAAAQPTAIPPTTAPGPKTYVLMPKALGNAYFDATNIGAQEAAKELGVTVKYTAGDKADAASQIEALTALIAQKVSGIAISGTDKDALVPTLKQAMTDGIPIITWDSDVAKDGRKFMVNQASVQKVGEALAKMALDAAGPDGGKIAILSATSTATNQNAWIAVMKEELKKPAYAKLNLVDTVYGDDEAQKSYTETLGLLTKYPDLKVIVAPTGAGFPSVAKAIGDQKKIGKVLSVGLATPKSMTEYLKSGAATKVALWNMVDLGYLSIQALNAFATGKIQGKEGEKFTAGRLGEYTITNDPDMGLNILLGDLTQWDKSNIDTAAF